MIRLEKFERNDFEQLIGWITDEGLLTDWSGAMFNFPLTTKSLEWYIEDTNIEGSSDAFVYKVVDTDNGNNIGHISLGGISWKNRSARITRVLTGSTNDRGKGYCRSMINAVLKVGFDELKLHRISLGVYDDNIAALNCYSKTGLKEEGVSRDILWQNGAWRSMKEMSMLEHEWRAMNIER